MPTKIISGICLLAASLCSPSMAETAPGQSAWLFTYFHGNGEDGLHLAWSRDAYNWTPLKNDASFLTPTLGDKLMRDPCLRQAPDGRYHMVWTTGWHDKGFGYSHSEDLIHWAPQKYVPVNEKTKGARNTWAPELFHDADKGQWLVIWATTIEGAYPDQKLDDGGLNHRLYYTATKDFETFSEARLFLDPGYNCIDGSVIKANNKYYLIFKDERLGKKAMRSAVADSAEGPYTQISEPFTEEWSEGPSPIKIGGEWFVYYDHYTDPVHYGAVKTSDLVNWENVSDKMRFPKDFRHGTILEVDEKLLDSLMK